LAAVRFGYESRWRAVWWARAVQILKPGGTGTRSHEAGGKPHPVRLGVGPRRAVGCHVTAHWAACRVGATAQARADAKAKFAAHALTIFSPTEKDEGGLLIDD
jgi:hypothetical protein